MAQTRPDESGKALFDLLVGATTAHYGKREALRSALLRALSPKNPCQEQNLQYLVDESLTHAAFRSAAMFDAPEALELLLPWGQTDLHDFHGYTALGSACVRSEGPGLLELLRLLNHSAPFSEPIDVHKEEVPSFPLWFCARHGNASAIRALIRAGANPNQQDRYQQTAVHSAAHTLRPAHMADCLRALFEEGADFLVRDTAGQTPYDLLRINDPQASPDGLDFLRSLAEHQALERDRALAPKTTAQSLRA